MKNYSDEIFVKQFRSIKFPDYSNYTRVNDVYQEFVTKLLSVIVLICSRFDIDLLMLFETVTSTMKSSIDHSRKLAMAILSVVLKK